MATFEVVSETVITRVQLTLNAEEAGYLLDLLTAHVGGELTEPSGPLGNILGALKGAKVKRIYARNSKGNVYASLYRQ